MKKVAILGSTGSIGTQTLDYIRTYPDKFEVISLSAGNNIELLKTQIKEFNPKFISILNQSDIPRIKKEFPRIDIHSGEQSLLEAVQQDVDIVLVAISGISALMPTLKAIECGKDIAIANKELLVAAGDLVVKSARKNNIALIPVDSEHSAIIQILNKKEMIDGFIDYNLKGINKMVLTASGGSFRDTPIEELDQMGVDEALKHPTWQMGKKITIDSATMMNKGLEIIEAQKLFGLNLDKIDVLIHPQSYIHGLVEYDDGAVIAQMGPSDMRIPIAYALSYGAERNVINNQGIGSFLTNNSLDFYTPDFKKYPALDLAYNAGRAGGIIPAVMNAANEESVSLFLKKMIKFTEITNYVKLVLDKQENISNPGLEEILLADKVSREEIKKIYQQRRE